MTARNTPLIIRGTVANVDLTEIPVYVEVAIPKIVYDSMPEHTIDGAVVRVYADQGDGALAHGLTNAAVDKIKEIMDEARSKIKPPTGQWSDVIDQANGAVKVQAFDKIQVLLYAKGAK